MQDIIPPHGFIHKPSLIWPICPKPGEDGRIRQTESYPPPQPGHADTLQPDEGRINESRPEQASPPRSELKQKEMTLTGRSSTGRGVAESSDNSGGSFGECGRSFPNGSSLSQEQANHKDSQSKGSSSSWIPKPPKVLMEDPDATPLELRAQIQLYATNELVIMLLC